MTEGDRTMIVGFLGFIVMVVALGVIRDKSIQVTMANGLASGIRNNNVELVREELAKNSLDGNSRVRWGTGSISSLVYALDKGAGSGIIRLLIGNGADVNASCRVGGRPLRLAINLSRLDAAKMLIRNGAILEDKKRGKSQTTRALLETKSREDAGWEELLQLAERIEQRRNFGSTPSE